MSITLLAINWTSVGLKVAQLLLSLSILILLHEFGHYITARWFKCRVDKFYLFFDPWFSIVKKKIGDTEYGIGWLPLGGYCKIAGMVDETMDKDQIKLPPQPHEFRSKPAWQRLIILLGGVTVNVLLAFLIYAMILFVWGEKKTPNSSIRNGVWVTDSLMYKIGIRNGDKIVSINDKEEKYFEDIPKRILFNGGSIIKVNRNGRDTSLKIPVEIIGQLVEKKRSKAPLLLPRVPAIVGEFDKKDSSNAKNAGLQYLDKVVKLDSVAVQFLDDLVTYNDKHKNSTVIYSVNRKGTIIQLPVAIDSEGRAGMPLMADSEYVKLGAYTVEIRKFGFFESFPAGVNRTFASLSDYIDQFKLIFKPSTEAYKGLGGFKSMGSIFAGDGWDWESFWRITALFSIILAFMNLLPIPALDGGHVVFTLYEMITRRKPNEKFLEYAQIVGMVILLALMLYANGNDWLGWGKGK